MIGAPGLESDYWYIRSSLDLNSGGATCLVVVGDTLMTSSSAWCVPWRPAPRQHPNLAPLSLVAACRKPWWYSDVLQHPGGPIGFYPMWTPEALADPYVRAALLDGLESHPVEPTRVEIPKPMDVGWWEVGSPTFSQPGLKGDRKVKDPATPVVAEPPARDRRLRLRKRGKATRALQAMAETLGRWWRDLPEQGSRANAALSWLDSHLGVSAPVKGYVSRTLKCQSVDDKVQEDVVIAQLEFSSEEGARWLWVCPELIATLYTVRLFRPVSESLLASLRSRARLWAMERGLPVMDLARVLAGSLVVAALPMPDEVVAVGSLRGLAGQWSNDVLVGLAAGRLAPTKLGRSWGDVLRAPVASLLGLKRLRGDVFGGDGCSPLQLPK